MSPSSFLGNWQLVLESWFLQRPLRQKQVRGLASLGTQDLQLCGQGNFHTSLGPFCHLSGVSEPSWMSSPLPPTCRLGPVSWSQSGSRKLHLVGMVRPLRALILEIALKIITVVDLGCCIVVWLLSISGFVASFLDPLDFFSSL